MFLQLAAAWMESGWRAVMPQVMVALRCEEGSGRGAHTDGGPMPTGGQARGTDRALQLNVSRKVKDFSE